jgi:hypothetical protein
MWVVLYVYVLGIPMVYGAMLRWIHKAEMVLDLMTVLGIIVLAIAWPMALLGMVVLTAVRWMVRHAD